MRNAAIRKRLLGAAVAAVVGLSSGAAVAAAQTTSEPTTQNRPIQTTDNRDGDQDWGWVGLLGLAGLLGLRRRDRHDDVTRRHVP